MPEAQVLFGEVVGPCSLWLVPDRGATRDLKCVRKVVKLEEKLAELCCEQEKDLMAGKVVAVMHESLMVRARIENIDANGKLQLFLLDWGVTRVRSAREAMKIPESVHPPSRCLAHKVSLGSNAAAGNEEILQELVEACGRGKLSEQKVLPGGEVTGVLFVRLSCSSPFVHRYYQNFGCSMFALLFLAAGTQLLYKELISPLCASTPFCQRHLQCILRSWLAPGPCIWPALMEKTRWSHQSSNFQSLSWLAHQVQPRRNQMTTLLTVTVTRGV